MRGVRAEKTELTVALVGGRRFREQCLAHFLEMSGVRIMTAAVEDLSESLGGQKGEIDLVLIDAGNHTCRELAIRKIFASLGDIVPSVPVVVVSDREEAFALFEALDLGIRAYFPSSLDPEILLGALQFVQGGGTFVPPEVLVNAPMHRRRTQDTELKRMAGRRGLTLGEQRVLELLRTGQPNKVIARELNLQESTVKVYVRRIMKKLNAANRTQAALLAQ